MYVTRPLSLYRKNPKALSLEPPEGPNSGYLVIYDEEADQTPTCFGLSNDNGIRYLPFPQNKVVNIADCDYSQDVVFVPVLNHPLSSNRYFAIVPYCRYKGEAFTSSKEENMGTSCFGRHIQDVKTRPLDPSDAYQQFEIITEKHHYGFTAKSIASDGFPPDKLRYKYWTAKMQTPKYYKLMNQALGLNSSLRATLPSFDFPSFNDSSASVVVGKWYCPFMFVEEVMKLEDQVKKSMFYEMTLEQRWVRVFECENLEKEGKLVSVNVVVETEDVCVVGRKAAWDENKVKNKVVWFRSYDDRAGHQEFRIGLNMVIVERMKWEQERFGWVGGDGRKGRVERSEEFDGTGTWTKFGCYVLVERFVLKRMDGSLVLTYDFKHTNQIRCKWDYGNGSSC
ncbi:hypothetical protein PanWU01x14_266180 [Parasponia andersonii]|uniref:Uncharacterized protein n=1 Tax=Parasponia andersonii TaxID=3476 RepID=A0A2P5B6V9_PARAD|nr:hypothetical protein PanWU01x14_266180 [Parasponia andersonii]